MTCVALVWHTGRVKRLASSSPRLALAATLLSLWAVGLCPARADALSAADAVARTRTNNERVHGAAARVDAARARLERARALLWPDVAATAAYTRNLLTSEGGGGGQGAAGFGMRGFQRDANQLSAGLGLTWTLLDLRAFPLLDQARLSARAAELDAAEVDRALAYEAARAWLSSRAADQVAEAAQRRAALARQSRADAQARLDARLVGTNDLTRASLEVASADTAASQARLAAAQAQVALAEVIGAAAHSEPLRAEGPSPWTGGVTEAPRAVRGDLAARREALAAQSAFAQEAERRVWPRLALEADYGWSSDAGFSGRNDSASVGVTLTLPLFDGFERDADAAERQAVLREQAASARALERGIAHQVARAQAEVGSGVEGVESATRAVEAARQNVTETQSLYAQGLVTQLEAADAGVRLFEAEVALARAELGLSAAHLALRQAMGLEPLGDEK